MTRKQLIDHCNAFWGKKGYCSDCVYDDTYCSQYNDNYKDTPYMEDKYHAERYTDDEIVLEGNK